MSGLLINLALVDDHILFTNLLRDFLTQQKDLEVTVQASSPLELFARLKLAPVDVLLIDLIIPDLNGEETLRMIRQVYPHIKVIVLSMCTDILLINRLMDIGIYGFISKADDPGNLLEAIYAVSQGKIYRNKLLTEALYSSIQNNIKNGANNIVFDEREKKILQLLWEEKSNKEIANEIFLSDRSVEKIRQQMKEKLGVKSTIGLLKYALAHKIIRDNNIIVNSFRN
jgi:DNA-binding NarL/FixJ family response regulator